MRLVEEREALSRLVRHRQAIVADDVAGEARWAAEADKVPSPREGGDLGDFLGTPSDEVPASAGTHGITRLGGPSCLAGDVIGDYHLPVPNEPGERFAFLDQAHYSMVKTNTFNGVPLPSIWLWDSDTDGLEQIKSFGYQDFRDRLS